MRRLYPALLLVAALALIAWTPAKPKVKAARAVAVAPAYCPATGNCVAVLAWLRPANYVAATDTAHVVWDQTAPTAFLALRTGIVLGTVDTLSITRPADGKTKSGTVSLCYTRAGWTGQACNAAIAWSVTAPVPVPVVPPVDTATSLQITPGALSLKLGQSVHLNLAVLTQ